MKTSKLFTIDIDLAERLKNVNGSAIVNTLLKEYFELRSGKNTLRDEKKAVFDAIVKKKSNFPKKLRLLMSGIHLVLITFRKHGLKRGWRSLQDLLLIRMWRTEDWEHYLKNLKKDTNYFKNTEKS